MCEAVIETKSIFFVRDWFQWEVACLQRSCRAARFLHMLSRLQRQPLMWSPPVHSGLACCEILILWALTCKNSAQEPIITCSVVVARCISSLLFRLRQGDDWIDNIKQHFAVQLQRHKAQTVFALWQVTVDVKAKRHYDAQAVELLDCTCSTYATNRDSRRQG